MAQGRMSSCFQRITESRTMVALDQEGPNRPLRVVFQEEYLLAVEGTYLLQKSVGSRVTSCVVQRL